MVGQIILIVSSFTMQVILYLETCHGKIFPVFY